MTKTLSYRDAINDALQYIMRNDERAIVYGIDVADHKRIFGTTNDLVEQFGHERCFSTPLCEDALLGFGLGAAISGLRPINIHMRLDFLLLAMNQLINMVSCYSYSTNGKFGVPLVIRAVIGKGWGQGYQHSKSLQSFFAHIPGLKVVMPTTPDDARALLIAAHYDNNPVLVLEHRLLYDIVDEVSENTEPEVIGTAKVLRQGSDLTLIATSYMLVEAMKAAAILAKQGVNIEVIDPRSISPLDSQTLCQSVNKTKHCIVADYDWLACGFASECAAIISEQCFYQLKAPVSRLGFAQSPCPTTRPLETLFFSDAKDIIRKVEEILQLDATDLSAEDFYSYENKFKGPF